MALLVRLVDENTLTQAKCVFSCNRSAVAGFYEKIWGKTTSLTPKPERLMTAWRTLEFRKPFVVSLEQGKKTPNAATILKIADFFAVSLDQLMRDELEVDG